MSRLHKLSHTIWHCQYHILLVPKYRHRILGGPIKEAVDEGIYSIWVYAGCEVVEMNAQKYHVRLIGMVPPKLAISDSTGRLKGQVVIKLFKQFRHVMRKKPYRGDHLWWKGYCVDTVGLNREMIRKYVKYQEEKDRYIDLLILSL